PEPPATSAPRLVQAANLEDPVRVALHPAHEDGDLGMRAGRAVDRVSGDEAADRGREHEHDDQEPAPVGAHGPLPRLPRHAATISDAVAVLPVNGGGRYRRRA